MTQLIQISDIQELKPLTSNANPDKKVNTFVIEAQEFDLRPVIGDAFYLELLLKAPGFGGVYDALWNGSTYQCGSTTYSNPGLKAVLIYYSWARITAESNITSTAFGLHAKLNEDSTPISDKALTAIVDKARSGAQAYCHRVVDFLNANSSDYPLYKCATKNGRTGGLRISSVGN
jgi:hypothetical protein